MSYVLTKRSKKSLKKKKLLTNIQSSSDESDGESSAHELSHYKNDKIRMMKEVLKILNPKKIKSMAPDCIKHLDIEELNAMLLEELLGISNKRLGYIFNGENPDRESSSSESEDEKVAEVISLDDISDDDIEICIGPDDKNAVVDELDKRYKKHKTKSKTKSIKSEKSEKSRKRTHHSLESNQKKIEDSNLMSVLELLELQARARAIRSQLALEAAQKKEKETENVKVKLEEISDDDDDAVIVQSPKKDEIVIDSSDSDKESESHELQVEKTLISSELFPHRHEESEKLKENTEQKKNKQKIKIIRDWSIQNDTVTDNLQVKENIKTCIPTSIDFQNNSQEQIDKQNASEHLKSNDNKENKLQKVSSPLHNEIQEDKENSDNLDKKDIKKTTRTKDSHSECGDEIVINLDEDEMIEVEHS